jgi:hypothetical protein
MPIWLKLAALPWGPILHGAAELLKRANERRVVEKLDPAELTNDLGALRERVATLEKQQQSDGELIHQLASQLNAVVTTAQALDARLRLAFGIAIAGVLVGIIALIVAVWR